MKKGLSRRQFLRGSAAGAFSLFLAANGIRLGAQESTYNFNLPDAIGDFPTGDFTLRWIDSAGEQATFWNAFMPAFSEKHPNVDFSYDPLPWNEIAQIVPLGVRNGSAHDVFQKPLNITFAQVVNEGWVSPLDDYIPNFEEWKATFPPGIFLDGVTGFDGVTYRFPVFSNKRYGTHLLYNVDYMQEAGFDPNEGPLSTDEFVEAARIITENGNGAYYGFILGGNQLNRWGQIVDGFAQFAGVPNINGISYETGEYVYNTPEYAEAVNVLLRLRDDGSVFPGVLSMNAPQARAMVSQEAVGMILQGPWNIPQWRVENPDLNFDLGSQPLLDPDNFTPRAVGSDYNAAYHIYADAPEEHKIIAGEIFHYMGTTEGQTAWASIASVAPPIKPEVIEMATMGDLERKAALLFSEQMRLAPNPVVRNSAVSEIFLELRGLTPNLNEVVQGLYTGQLEGVEAQLQDLRDRSEAELDRAIAAAQEKGADVSRDDFVFSNWNPQEDYSAEDYAEA